MARASQNEGNGPTAASENVRNLDGFVWSVADILRGDFKQSEYGKVVLPFVVLRRLDCIIARFQGGGSVAIPKERNRSMDERAIDQRRRCRLLGQHGSGEQIMSIYWVIGGWNRRCDAAGRLQRAG
ncbi:type I restriction-modification system subunit M N-terminal domain-containing protein [Ruegeria sp.]|uniref:type I restriction-modification system subunit M N-terminal domain-containing protein n=1 Tax=Ruegeria sp. TaxID=1879320 RepID=UPI003B00ABEB